LLGSLQPSVSLVYLLYGSLVHTYSGIGTVVAVAALAAIALILIFISLLKLIYTSLHGRDVLCTHLGMNSLLGARGSHLIGQTQSNIAQYRDGRWFKLKATMVR